MQIFSDKKSYLCKLFSSDPSIVNFGDLEGVVFSLEQNSYVQTKISVK